MAKPREKRTRNGDIRVVSFTIGEDQLAAMTTLAVERRSNRSILLREAIDTYLRIHGRDPRRENVEGAA